MAFCSYPGSVDDPPGFFKLQQAAHDVQRVVPLDRWDADMLHSVGPQANKIYARYAAVHGGAVAEFDTGLFGMNRAEAGSTDPQVLFRGLQHSMRAEHLFFSQQTPGNLSQFACTCLCVYVPSIPKQFLLGFQVEMAISRRLATC